MSAWAIATPCLVSAAEPARLADRVLVVYNRNVRDSLDVAEHYVARRGIPNVNLCAIRPPQASALDWGSFEGSVKVPLQKCLERAGRDKILYIIFTYETPWRLDGLPNGPHAIDQFIADIWDEAYPPRGDPAFGRPHPYFAGAQSQGNVYSPFVSFADYRASPSARTVYSVWRLDGANAQLAKDLVDKAIAAETSGLRGQACFDRNRGEILSVPDWEYGSGDWDLHMAAEFARETGFAVTEDSHEQEFGTPPAPVCHDAALYSGWYSLDHYNDAFTWKTGAIGFHLDSSGAKDPRGGTNWSANAIIKGITVTSGAVGEPYLEGMAHPDGVFRNLFEGANVGDAFLRNIRQLKWKILNLGDPLYRPFPNGLPPFNSGSLASESSLAFAHQVMPGGAPGLGMITLAKPAPAGGTLVSLRSTDPKSAALPENVRVPQGARSATFSISTTWVAQRTYVRISALGPVNRTNTLVLMPPSQGR
ncbi:MAG TPA: TIGR03790 family protein [Terriglobia bacterium]|nr:TIGR03790 family protein [Terriglobia bacterium]